MTAPKRVVHLTTVHHPYDPRIYHKECLSLYNAGLDVTLIAQVDTETAQDKPIKHIPVKTYTSRFKRMIFGTIEAYKKAKTLDADVYHFHDPELLPAAWLLKRKNNVVIYDIHEDYVTSIMQKEYMSTPVKKVIASTYKYMEKFFSREMELCLAEKYYKDIYPRGKCILNYPTINENFINHNRNDAPLEDKLLYTGNVSHVRGALIHAKIPLIDESVSVHFVGKCPSDLADEMYAVAGNKKDNLEIEGIDRFIEKEDMEARYLSRNWLAGIALFPPTEHYMKKELTKFFEYMNAGLPIICSNFPVWKEFVETYECGIAVDPYDESEIKQAIEYLRNNQDVAKRMGENGRKAVMKYLNWHTEENKLITWYDQLTNQSMQKDRAE
ncbi:glycosyltransferase involved in cell wall biosynthesis [Virgibacillus natechei]|uniref:Glycosyltransferase involved in cell wall biosynthesis n=1 Tax=Virgibacillus natechei TaxID=1216297 RepID=A0ABS4IKM1_9BACI|nr:glycosyltransferase [Virgibacillus natechei]MBP1971487.1 glycosyltransferase involved in cell wall biosynthesis [Virgibacillus natechei]UZD12541.1 glycosyltransferase [Virgibacillus natechei]